MTILMHCTVERSSHGVSNKCPALGSTFVFETRLRPCVVYISFTNNDQRVLILQVVVKINRCEE